MKELNRKSFFTEDSDFSALERGLVGSDNSLSVLFRGVVGEKCTASLGLVGAEGEVLIFLEIVTRGSSELETNSREKGGAMLSGSVLFGGIIPLKESSGTDDLRFSESNPSGFVSGCAPRLSPLILGEEELMIAKLKGVSEPLMGRSFFICFA